MSDARFVGEAIRSAARSCLQPMGLTRKGRSRLWFDDHGWWLIVVEFQPGSGCGTYLNVGAMWLWADRDDWVFDEGHRVYWRRDGSITTKPALGEAGWSQHLDFVNPEQFSEDVALLADAAARRVTTLRDQFPDVAAVAEYLTSRPTHRTESPLWHAFHRGAAAALDGELQAAEQSFMEVTKAELRWDWEHALASQASDLLDLVSAPARLRNRIEEKIERTRERLRLPAVELGHHSRASACAPDG